MGALLRLLAIGLLLFDAILAGSNGGCEESETCESTANFKNTTLTPAERADSLLKLLTWEEKVGQMGGIRAAFKSVNGSIVFNRTSFEQIRATQNGQIGKLPDILNYCVMFLT